MLDLSRFRIAALAVLALGTLQLSTARAASPAGQGPCEEYSEEEMIGLLIGICDELTGGDWEEGAIWCEDGEMYGECNSSAE